MLGADVIVADGESPQRFDFQNIRVDLIDAADLIEVALREVRKEHGRHAYNAVRQA